MSRAPNQSHLWDVATSLRTQRETRPLTLLDVRLTQQITRPKSMGQPKTLVASSVLGSPKVRSVGTSKPMTTRAYTRKPRLREGRLKHHRSEHFARFARALRALFQRYLTRVYAVLIRNEIKKFKPVQAPRYESRTVFAAALRCDAARKRALHSDWGKRPRRRPMAGLRSSRPSVVI